MFRVSSLSKAARIGSATRSFGSFDLIMSIALKFTSLAIRTVAKPIGTLIKAQAKEHPTFRRMCVQLAQSLHQVDVKLKIKLLGQKNIKVRPLNENKAIENGANFISESFIFSVAGSLIFYESYRQRKKELSRREAVSDDISMLQEEIEFLKQKLGQYVKIEDYRPTKEYHPAVLRIEPVAVAKNDLAVANDENKSSPVPPASIQDSKIINMILTKLNQDEVRLFQENESLKIKQKQLFEESEATKTLFLKMERIGE